MANMNVENQAFKLPIEVTGNGKFTKTLKTADTYVDKNIDVEVNVADATYKKIDTGTLTAAARTTDTIYTQTTATPYSIDLLADAEITNVVVGVDQAGYADSTDTVTVEGSTTTSAPTTIYIKEGALDGGGSASAEGGNGVELISVGQSAPTDGSFYIKASGSGSVGVVTAGWVDPDNTRVVSTDGDAYYTLKKASFSNASSNTSDLNDEADVFTTVAGPVLRENGYLFIEEGYIENTKISLADLVPDDANITDENSDLVYNTVKAYDKDGKLIVGTMGNAELGAITATDATATVTNIVPTLNGTNFSVSGTGAISGSASVQISKRGLAETTLSQNGSVSGTATVDATLNKIGLGVSADETNVKVTPVIRANDASTVIHGDAAKTPSGDFYVAVDTAAIDKSVGVNPVVNTAGYGISGTNGSNKTGATITAGAATSGTYYVPVQAGSHTINGAPEATNATASIALAPNKTAGSTANLNVGILSSAPASGDYITISSTTTATRGNVAGNIECVSTTGYSLASTETYSLNKDVEVSVTESAKYIRVYDGSIL